MYKKLLIAFSVLCAAQMAQASLFSGFKRLFNKRAAVIAQKVPVTQVQGSKISNVPTKKYDFSRKSGQSGKSLLFTKSVQTLNRVVRDATQKQQLLGLVMSKKHEADQQRRYKSLEQAGKDKALLDKAKFEEEILPALKYEICTANINKSARQNLVDFMGSEVIKEGEEDIQLLSRINVDQEDLLLILHSALADDVSPDDNDFVIIDNELARRRHIMQDNIYEPDNIGCPAA